MKKALLTTLMGLIVVLSGCINFSTVQTSASDLILTNRSVLQNYTVHAPITITNDDELAAVANSGTGTAIDPYIITGWNITGSTTHGISITRTTKHFCIQNCWIGNSTNCGIYLHDIHPGTATIFNNCINNWRGIKLEFSRSSSVVNNTCTNPTFYQYDAYGISISSSGSSIIDNNICTNNEGINLENSESLTVSNNTCNNGRITLHHSSFSVIVNNICHNGGIILTQSDFSSVIDNTLYNGGLSLPNIGEWSSFKGELLSYIVENNIVNTLPLGYFENLTDSTITGAYGQLIFINCNNTIVKNQNCSNTLRGIALYYCENTQLVNNTCTNNGDDGISLWYSGSSTVTNNTCNSNSGYGISLEFSGSSTLTTNTCNSNIWDGISFKSSSSSTVAYNTFNNNYYYGIESYNSHSCFLVWNMLRENRKFGIALFVGSDNNSIHHNSFIENGQDNSQAFDDGTNNQWYDDTVLEGNYWSDYSGVGNYSIDGLAGASDPYPIDNPSLRKKGIDDFSILTRIGLFLGVLGVLTVLIFLTRRK